MNLKNAEICYLLAFPDPAEDAYQPPEQISGLKDAPYFQPVDISVKTLEQVKVEAGGVEISITRQRYDDRIQIVECQFIIEDAVDLKTRAFIEKSLQEKFIPAEYRINGMFEEYVILLLRSALPSPDKFIDKNAVALSRFIRSQRETFDERSIQDILSSRRLSSMILSSLR